MTREELKKEVHSIICTRNLDPDEWCKEAENDMLELIDKRAKEAYVFGRELIFHSEYCGGKCNCNDTIKKADKLGIDNAFKLWNNG